jgi:hypothetical protein
VCVRVVMVSECVGVRACVRACVRVVVCVCMRAGHKRNASRVDRLLGVQVLS